MRRRRRRLSIGSVLVLLLTIAAVIGTVFFLREVGRDSPAAAMGLDEIAETVGRVLLPPAADDQQEAPTALPPAALAQQEEAEATPTPPIGLTMSIGGLLHFDSDVQASDSHQSTPQDILAPIQAAFHGDINIAGFDQLLVPPDEAGTDLLVPDTVLNQLDALGLNALVVTTERLFDRGVEQAAATAAQMAQRFITPIGFGETRTAFRRVNGLSLAWLHAGSRLSNAGEKATTAEQRAALTHPWDPDALGRDISTLKRQHDLVIVSLDWDIGRAQSPTPAQQTLAHRLAQEGADIILGYGGERVQEVEVYQLTQADDEPRDVLIGYSMGTLLTEERNKRDNLAGLVLQLDMLIRPDGSGMQLRDLTYTPTYVRKWNEGSKVRFAVLPSNQPAPQDMSRSQREAMTRALELIDAAMRVTRSLTVTN